MLTEERQDCIRRQLAVDGRVVAAALAQEFGVSEDTVRRDLRELAKAGLCRRVYGGALAPAPDIGPLSARTSTASASKARLAAMAATLLQPRQTVFIDAGSTNIATARALPRDLELTVVTNAPGVAAALDDHPRVRVIVLGGTYNQDKGACLGGTTLSQVRQVYADLFLLGACGLDPAMGITALDAEEAEVKRAMLDQSAALMVAATSDKLMTVAPFKLADSDKLDHLIVEASLGTDATEPFARLGATIHRAG